MLKTISDISVDKLKRIVKALPIEKKMEVLTMLEKELFAARFKSLLKEFRESAKKNPVTLEEITEEVEVVRRRRYESRN